MQQCACDHRAQVNGYNFNNPGWSSSTGLFTQMVWKDTTAVGCYVNRNCAWAMYVCQYTPSGNLIGAGIDWNKEVMRPISSTPATAAVGKPGRGHNRLYTPFDLGEIMPDDNTGNGRSGL